MPSTASDLNRRGNDLADEGRIEEAIAVYLDAAEAAPDWPIPCYNLGLQYKRLHAWAESLHWNRLAAELDPSDEATWWNLGIAATALGDWDTARRAWARFGLEVPAGSGPLEMGLGTTPIRLDPDGEPEVVWCWRIDPARAIVESIPFPGSGYGWGDLVLHDGEPQGERLLDGEPVPVFDALELLEPAAYNTFVAGVVAPSLAAAVALRELAERHGLGCEDWSTVRVLCKACSEGRPHAHPDPDSGEWVPERRFALAARSTAEARQVLELWAGEGGGRMVEDLECALDRGD